MKSTRIIETDKESYLFISNYENKNLKLYLSNGLEVYYYQETMQKDEKSELISNELILKSFFEFSENENKLEINEYQNEIELKLKFYLKKGGDFEGKTYKLKKNDDITIFDLMMILNSIILNLKKENEKLKILSNERDDAIQLNETLLNEKDQIETNLISKFLKILNTKKGKKEEEIILNDLLDQSF
eukprot:gene3472-6121_t